MNKKSIILTLSGLVAGILITLGVLYSSAQNVMLTEDKVPYTFDKAVMHYTNSVKKHGWKIPKVHDLQKTMEKFGNNVNKVKVFELCHPDHAKRILEKDEERIVSSLMPCRVAIYEKSDGQVYVSRMNTGLMGSMMSGIVPEVMKEASKDSEAILQAILSKNL